MVKWEIYDGQNQLLFTEGYIPHNYSIRLACPRSPHFYRDIDIDFPSRDAATAWLLSAFARRVVCHDGRRHLYGGDPGAALVPLETWLIGPPRTNSGILKSWFEGETSETTYRLMIHRAPTKWLEKSIPSPWRDTHYLIKMKSKQRGNFKIRHKEGRFDHLKQGTMEFLGTMLTSYGKDCAQVQSMLNDSGHSFWFSAGSPECIE
jgi:hypothetical protein